MKTARCPSCSKFARSASVNRDGLCDRCRGNVRKAVPRKGGVARVLGMLEEPEAELRRATGEARANIG